MIPHLFEEEGTGFPRRLDGMFAIALHDVERRRLVLVRDRLGIKPLFYAIGGGQLVFGSEIKALLASGSIERGLDLDALGQFLAWEYVPTPHTLFPSVRKLPAGCFLEVDLAAGSWRVQSYWELPAAVQSRSDRGTRDEEWVERIDEQVSRSVQSQLVSDVPLGAFLSGGVDSSLVVSRMGKTEAFCISFADASYDESRWAEKVAGHLGVALHRRQIEPDVASLFEHLMDFMEDPIADFSIFPTYLISRLAREHVTVALTGDGGDELFGGYEQYSAQQAARLWSRLPTGLRAVVERRVRRLRPRPQKKGWINRARRFTEGLEHGDGLGAARWRVFAGEALRSELFTRDALESLETPVGHHVEALRATARGRGDLDADLYTDVKSYLVDNCLVKVDRMSMACSLEARVPLLDHRLVELAFEVPERLKVRGLRSKILLKRVAARRVPESAVYRPKQGFSIPIKSWLRGELSTLMQDLLATETLDREGIFRSSVIERLRREHSSGSENHSHVLWALMVFQEWRRRWSA